MLFGGKYEKEKRKGGKCKGKGRKAKKNEESANKNKKWEVEAKQAKIKAKGLYTSRKTTCRERYKNIVFGRGGGVNIFSD
jgi:hypothetical protein